MTTDKSTKDDDTKDLYITVIGVLGFFLVFFVGRWLAGSQWNFTHKLAPIVTWSGIIFLLIYLFLFVENSGVAKLFGGKFTSSIVFAAIGWYLYTQASLTAGGYINEVFGLGDSVFPQTQKVLTFVSLFILVQPLFILLTIWSSIAFLYYLITGGSGTHKSFQAFMFAISGLTIGLIALMSISYKFSDDSMPKKAYLLALSLEFNEKLNCSQSKIIGKGVFIGPAQDRVIVDTTNNPSMSWASIVYANESELKDIKIPENFEIYECRKS
jgi:hypothetical protein